MRRWFSLLPAIALGALALGSALPAGASQPSSGTLSWSSTAVTWTNSVPMAGSAPAVRRLSCTAEVTACDDFTLTINRGSDPRSVVDLKLTPSSGASMTFVYYPPGCAVSPTTTCYQTGGLETRLIAPANGDWVIRTTCTSCAGASYSMTATLADLVGDILPAAGDQSFHWATRQLPGDPASTSFGEPGISINKLGHVVVNTFGPTVWISHDDGKTFADPQVPDPTPCNQESGDADAQVANDDTYYVDNLCLAGGTNLSFTSRDGGTTWNPSRSGLPAFAGTDSDRQWYAVDPSTPGVVYFSYHDLEGPNIWVQKSTDYGQTFTQLAPITVGAANFVDTSQGNTSSRPLVDPTDPNTLTVLYSSNSAQQSATAPPTNTDFDLNRFYMAQSHDGGSSWTNTEVLDAGQTDGQDNTVAHEFPQSTIDAAGNIYLIFSERLGGHTQTHIEMGVIPHGSTTMRGPWQVDQADLGANVFPWASAGDAGMLDITWYGSTSRDNNDTGSQWSEMFSQSVDALSAHPHFTQSRMSGNQPMHAADICLAGTLCLVTNGNRNLADFQGVAVDPCGYAEAVWTDDHTGTGVTMFARQTAGSSIRPSACVATTQSNVFNSAVQGLSQPSATAPSALPNTATTPVGSAAALSVTALALAVGTARRRRRRGPKQQ
jgi:hypothetical protein